MSNDNAHSVTGKVFDTDSNPVEARLLIFFSTAPSGGARPTIAADDLRIAVPVRFFGRRGGGDCPGCGRDSVCRLTDGDRRADWACIECGAEFDSLPGQGGGDR
jgi:hypothetical protein